jgi:hypothetical protein
MARKCNLGSHEVRHEFLYLPDCPVGLLGRVFLCKLRAQITFDSDGTAALKLRGPEAKTLILTVAQEEEWWLYAPEGRPLEIPKLPFKTPHIWAEDNPPRSGLKCATSSGRIKAGSHPHQPETILYSLKGPGWNSKNL